MSGRVIETLIRIEGRIIPLHRRKLILDHTWKEITGVLQFAHDLNFRSKKKNTLTITAGVFPQFIIKKFERCSV